METEFVGFLGDGNTTLLIRRILPDTPHPPDLAPFDAQINRLRLPLNSLRVDNAADIPEIQALTRALLAAIGARNRLFVAPPERTEAVALDSEDHAIHSLFTVEGPARFALDRNRQHFLISTPPSVVRWSINDSRPTRLARWDVLQATSPEWLP